MEESSVNYSIEGEAPPRPNRGVQVYNVSAWPKESVENFTWSVDWLAFTRFNKGDFYWLWPWLEPCPVGRRGYASSSALPGGGFLALSDGRQDVHCCLSSSSLGFLSCAFDAFDLLGYALAGDRGHITRLDLALDDKRASGGLNFGVILKHVEARRFVSRWRQINEIRGIVSDDGMLGHTLYFGARASDSFLRVYDKRAEVVNKGGDDPGPWVRVELELKGKTADAVGRKLAAMPEEKRGVWISSLLNGLIEFKEFSGDSNMRRVPMASWWRDLLGECGKTRLRLPKPPRNLETVLNWLMVQASPSLALLAEAGGPGYLDSLLRSGHLRFSDEHKEILKTHQDEMRDNQSYRLHWIELVRELVGAGSNHNREAL